jgi:hypothetical protein
MTTASDGVAVIATQLAQTDRRALSEAWYSALHLAGGSTSRTQSVPQRAGALRSPAPAAPATASHAGRQLVAAPASSPRHGAGARVEVGDERRRPVTDTARRIERAVVTLTARRPVPAAHTVEVAGGRVRLLVHDDGRATRIVALCSRPLREHVERALAHARFTLAAAGLTVLAP